MLIGSVLALLGSFVITKLVGLLDLGEGVAVLGFFALLFALLVRFGPRSEGAEAPHPPR